MGSFMETIETRRSLDDFRLFVENFRLFVCSSIPISQCWHVVLKCQFESACKKNGCLCVFFMKSVFFTVRI